jgi:UDP-N-acetyl-D-glucosamine dehydrogenase
VKQFGGAAKFIDLARDVNAAMPAYVVQRVQDLLNEHEKPMKGSRILILGVAYKPDVTDMRESPALPLIELLRQKSAIVSFADPHVARLRLNDGDELVAVDAVPAAANADCVVVVTAHATVDHIAVAAAAPLVFDTRNVLPRGGNIYSL